jgi:hypothetical protein
VQNAAPFQIDQPRSQRHEIDAEQLGHLGFCVNRGAHQELEKATNGRFHHAATVRINAGTRQSILGMSGMRDRLRVNPARRVAPSRILAPGMADAEHADDTPLERAPLRRNKRARL